MQKTEQNFLINLTNKKRSINTEIFEKTITKIADAGAPSSRRSRHLIHPYSKLVPTSIVLAAVQGDIQGFIHTMRDVLLRAVRQMMEERRNLRVPGRRVMVSLESEVHLGFLWSLSRRQDVAAVHGTRTDSARWRGASALYPVGRLIARYGVTEKNVQ